MRVQTYRHSKIQNGPVTRRRSRTSVPKVSERRASAGRSSRGKTARAQAPEQERPRGGNFIWTLMCVGALVGGGFIFALRSQINTHQLSQAETQLRAELDEIANRQRYEVQEQQRALSPQENDRTAKQFGLSQPKLNQADLKVNPSTGSRNQSGPSPKVKKESTRERQTARATPRR